MQLVLDGFKSVDGQSFLVVSLVTVRMNLCHLTEVIDRLKSYLENHPDIRDDTSRWIEGMGWDQTKWPGAQFPTAVSDPCI